MKEFLERLTDLLAAVFGDGKRRRPLPQRPPELPPAPPLPPVADPNEPQDSSEVNDEDGVVISHEAEEIEDHDTPEFEDNPAPPPNGEEEDPPTGEQGGTLSPPHPDHVARYMWCLDPGHGQHTRGKRSPDLGDGVRFNEYEFNRDILQRITGELDLIGVRYFVTVPEVEVGNFLKERVARANRLSSALPKIFVSIHANAGPARSQNDWTDDQVSGVETWYYHRSSKGRKIAAVFQKQLVELTGFKNRHLRSKVTGQFYVLRATRMPAILTENGFFNNRFEVRELMKDEVRQRIARAHVNAIQQIERDGI